MAQHGVLSEVDLQNVAVGRSPLRQDYLHQIQLRFFLQQQQDPRRDQPFATGHQHQLQRGNLAPDPQGQKLLTAGVVELHPPGFGASTAIQGVTERLLELRGGQSRDALRPDLILQGRHAAIEQKTHHPLRRCGECSWSGRPTGRKLGHSGQSLEIGESPGFLTPGGKPQTLQSGPTPLLHWCQHTSGHGQATP